MMSSEAMHRQPAIPGTQEPLYDRMVRRGVNMSWYNRSRLSGRGRAGGQTDVIPITDDQCCAMSIYMLKKDGTLWTINLEGQPYHQVRDTGKKLAGDTLICAHCRQQFGGMEQAKKHYEDKDES